MVGWSEVMVGWSEVVVVGWLLWFVYVEIDTIECNVH